MRRLYGLLVVVALLFGASYAGAIISWLIGPWSAVAIEHDGTATPMQFGPHLPRPEWVPVYPGATVVDASKVWPARAPSGFHALELATRASLDEVRRFYTDTLTTSGFAVTDLGVAPLDPLTAAHLGIAGTLSAQRAATDDAIDIRIPTPDGFIPSRLLQIHWRKISEYPAAASSAPTGR